MGSNFQISDMIRSCAADTWGKARSHEWILSEQLRAKYGPIADPSGMPQAGVRVPSDVLTCRDLQAAVASAGGYLAATINMGYVETLAPASVCLRLGAQTAAAPAGLITVPKGTTNATVVWLSSETSTITESNLVFGQIAGTPKIASAFVEISRQLLLQSNAEELVRRELRNACATALDAAIIAGSGASGQPQGVVNTAGIGGFTGAAITYAQALNAVEDVSANAVNGDTLGWVCPPAIATVLSQRVKLAATQPFLWEGSPISGTMLGSPAKATANCPAGNLLFGDWSAVTVFQWIDGGLQIMVDPFTKFSAGIVAIRILMPIDVVVTRPAAFSLGTSVS